MTRSSLAQDRELRAAVLPLPSLDAHDERGRARRAVHCANAMFTVAFFVNMVRHKHLKLNQAKIDKARKLLGTATEQETIERALDLVIAEAPILQVHRRVKKVGGVEDVFR